MATIYQFFELPTKKVQFDADGIEIENSNFPYECKYCNLKGFKNKGKAVTISTAKTTTSNLISHIKISTHKEIYTQYLVAVAQAAESKGDNTPNGKKNPNSGDATPKISKIRQTQLFASGVTSSRKYGPNDLLQKSRYNKIK